MSNSCSNHSSTLPPNLWCSTKFSLRRLTQRLPRTTSQLNEELQSQSSPDRQIDASAPQTSRKPIKSAMRTSRVGNNDRRALHPSKCVPSMPSGGVLLPMKPGNVPGSGPVAGGNGYVSPQWGWYISTTPPTPEKYYHAGKKPSQQPSSLQIMHPTPTSMPKGLQGERQLVSETHHVISHPATGRVHGNHVI